MLIAKHAIRIATEKLEILESYNLCRLIALNKNPGVRPIGIEVLRRIIVRTNLKCIQLDLKVLGGNVNCAWGKMLH